MVGTLLTTLEEAPVLPSWDELAADAHVVAIPMRVPFRGVDRARGAAAARPGRLGRVLAVPRVRRRGGRALARRRGRGGLDGLARAGARPGAGQRDRARGRRRRRAGRCSPASPAAPPPRSRSRRPARSLADDVDRVAAVRDVLGAAGRVRVDANGAWSVDDAVDAR